MCGLTSAQPKIQSSQVLSLYSSLFSSTCSCKLWLPCVLDYHFYLLNLGSLLGFIKISPLWTNPRDLCFFCCLTLMFWKLFNILKLSEFLVISGRRINKTPITPCWQKSWILLFSIFFSFYLPISLYLNWFSDRQCPISQSLHYAWCV